MNRFTRALTATLAFAGISSGAILAAPGAGAQTTNDGFAAPTVLASQATGQVAGSNVGATLEAGETALGGLGGSSVHYSIVAPISGSLRVSTAGSAFDTQVGVGTGTSAADLTFIAQNDDANGTLQSEVTVDAVQGRTYRIVVDGYRGAQGAHNVAWNFTAPAAPAPAGPAFDSFATPTVLASTTTGQVTGTNAGATLEAGEVPVAGVGGSSVHYSIVAPVTGTLSLSTAGSTYDTVLGAGEGATIAGLVYAGQNDDVDGGRQSRVTIDVVAGRTYRIVVDGYRGAEGNHTLAWTFTGQAVEPPAPETPPAGVDQAAFVQRLNQIRSEARTCMRNGVAEQMPAVPPVVTDPGLAQAAQAHSVDMAANNFFSHTGSDGSSFTERAARFGTTSNGENISAWGTMEQAFQSWLDSDAGHCQGLMSANATRVGAGFANNPTRTGQPGWANNWTMMTGA